MRVNHVSSFRVQSFHIRYDGCKMTKFLILLLYLCPLFSFGQGPSTTPPPYSILALNGSGQPVFANIDGSGNLYTASAGSEAAIVYQGYAPPVAMVGINPSGQYTYLRTDASGNLMTTSSGGSSIANVQLTLSTSSLGGNACTTPATATMTGLIAPSGATPGSTFTTAFGKLSCSSNRMGNSWWLSVSTMGNDEYFELGSV